MNNDDMPWFMLGYLAGLLAGFVTGVRTIRWLQASHKPSPPTTARLIGGPEDGREVLVPECVPEYHIQREDADTQHRTPTYIYRRTSPTTFQFRDKVIDR